MERRSLQGVVLVLALGSLAYLSAPSIAQSMSQSVRSVLSQEIDRSISVDSINTALNEVSKASSSGLSKLRTMSMAEASSQIEVDLSSPFKDAYSVVHTSVSEIKIRSEKPPRRRDEKELKAYVEDRFPGLPQADKDRLVAIYKDVDRNFYDTHQQMVALQDDGDALLRLALVRADAMMELYAFEVYAGAIRQLRPAELPQFIHSWEAGLLNRMMFRGEQK
jgi:hypothetical protein